MSRDSEAIPPTHPTNPCHPPRRRYAIQQNTTARSAMRSAPSPTPTGPRPSATHSAPLNAEATPFNPQQRHNYKRARATAHSTQPSVYSYILTAVLFFCTLYTTAAVAHVSHTAFGVIPHQVLHAASAWGGAFTTPHTHMTQCLFLRSHPWRMCSSTPRTDRTNRLHLIYRVILSICGR